MAIFMMVSFGSNILALPVGGTVSAGGAKMKNDADSLIISQLTQNAAINWKSFSIGQGETVQFVQPDSNSVALNRVLGSDPSSILGSLSANGKVFLVNPNGILFGKGAQVNVGGLVASTLNITDSDFMAGTYKFAGTGSGTVLNQGSLNTTSNGGYVALLGANVSNDGIISAKLGMVELAAGTAITLDVAGDGLLNVVVNQGALNALVQNGGLIQADGGQVLLTTQAAGSLLRNAVNNTGVIQAQTVENHNGTIKLLADLQSGSVKVSGKLDASAPMSGDGGFIETSGSQVSIADTARVDTMAAHGKTGLWLVDPSDFTIAVAGGDMTAVTLDSNLATSNVTISSNDGLVGTAGNINVNTAILWAGATTLTLNAVHDVIVNAEITASTAGANIVLKAGNDVNATAPIHTVAAASSISISAVNDVSVASIIGTAANAAINVSAGHNLTTTGLINAVAANSSISLNGGNNAGIGGPVTATAGATAINITAGQDATISAPLTAIAAGSLIRINAGRDLTTTTTAAIAAIAATTSIDLKAGRNVAINSAIAAGAAGSTISVSAGLNVNVNAALAASAAGSSISLLSGLGSSEPGTAGGTVTLAAAVASLNTTLRFNPNGYANSSLEIAAYVAEVTGGVDAKAWVYAHGNNRIYDGTNLATLSLMGNPGAGVSITSGTAFFDTNNAGTVKTVTFNGYAISGMGVSNFALFAGSGTTTANITSAPLTVTASSASKIYGQTPTLTAFTTAGLANGETIGSVTETSTGTAATANVAGGPYVITPSSVTGGTFSASNYTIGYINGALTVLPANLTVTAANASKTYGQTLTLTSFNTLGLINGETIGSVTESSSGTTATANVVGGPYAIAPGSATGGTFTASNYTIAYINGVLTVLPASLTVTVANATKTYGQTMTLTAFTVAGLANGETIGAFKETSPGSAASASVAGSPYVITANSASGGTFTSSNYTIAYVNGELTVTPLVQPLSIATAAEASGTALAMVPTIAPAWMPTVVPAEMPGELLSFMSALSLQALPGGLPDEILTIVPAR